jgi:hypothetical protein
MRLIFEFSNVIKSNIMFKLKNNNANNTILCTNNKILFLILFIWVRVVSPITCNVFVYDFLRVLRD